MNIFKEKTPLILIAEDNQKNIQILSLILKKRGYEVCISIDGEQALKHLEEKLPDLILLDIMMPKLDGFSVCKRLKENSDTKDIPVIFLSAKTEMNDIIQGFEVGGVDYLTKPFNKTELLARINTHLSLKLAKDILLEQKNKVEKTSNELIEINKKLSWEIGERKKIAEELLIERRHLEAIFRSVRDGIVTVDKNTNVIDINDAAGNICGFTRNDIGKTFQGITKHCRGECLNALMKTLESEKPVILNHIKCYEDSEDKKVVNLVTTPLLDRNGMSYGAVMVFKDDTRLVYLERELKERLQFHNILGSSKKMQKIYSLIETLANIQSTVLITGESGTGKELVADALHYMGERKNKPFIKVNCSALSESLLESELFGHVKGAFTGAFKDTKGRFQRAHTGTIFLDEIGDISPATQVRLLRVLQEGEFERLGDPVPVKVDVRVIAATNQNLREKISSGEFREDLYYRLKVVEILLPPLRERNVDIPMLVEHFLKKFNLKFKKDIKGISEEVKNIFIKYPWRGNIRELENTLEYACILCVDSVITVQNLPEDFMDMTVRPSSFFSKNEDKESLLDALEKTGWNKAKAARILGLSRQSIYRKIKEYGIKEK